MSTTDVVWMRYASGNPDVGAPDRSGIVHFLQAKQDCATGKVCHDPVPSGKGYCDGHAFWHTVRALNILEADLAWFPSHLAPMLTPLGLGAWFDSFAWDGTADKPRGNHHEVLGLIPAVASVRDERVLEMLFRKINEQQNRTTGTWPSDCTNISRTFAYASLHLAAGRLPVRPEGIVDEILRLQTTEGLWDHSLPGFHTMDATYLLVRLPSRIGYREKDAQTSLRKASDAMRRVFAERQADLMQDTHRMVAVVHTFGLLQEAMREEYPSERPYRFGWDDLDMYVCRVMARTDPCIRPSAVGSDR